MATLPLAMAILAGGSSARMGQDKAFLDAGRGPNLVRLVQLGITLQIPVLISGREQPTHWPYKDITFVPDELPGQGPLGGVVSALAHADRIICVACDFFALEVESLVWLQLQWKKLTDEKCPGLVVRHAAGIEPLCACYTHYCLAEARRRLHAGERALHRLIEATEMKKIAAPTWLIPQLANINTPAEWSAFQQQQQQQQ